MTALVANATGSDPCRLHLRTAEVMGFDDPGHCFMLRSGRIELAVDMDGEQTALFEISAGEIVLGCTGEVRLSGRALDETEIDVVALSQFVGETPPQKAADLLDRWLERLAALSDAQTSQDQSVPPVAITVGHQITTEDEVPYVASKGVLWVRRKLDEAAPYVVVTAFGPVFIPKGPPTEVQDTCDMLSEPDAAGIMAQTTVAFVSALAQPMRRRLEHEQRMQLRSEQDAGRMARANRLIESALSSDGHKLSDGPTDTIPGFSPLARLAERAGYTLSMANARHSGSAIEGIKALCDANNLRYRQIALTDKWWVRDAGDFLAFDEKGQALAVMREAWGYVVCDSQGTKRRFRADMAEQIQGAGLMIYWPLPERLSHGGQVLRHVIRRCSGDLKTLIGVSAASSVLTLSLPVMTGALVGAIIPQQDKALLVQIGVILAAVSGVLFVVSVIAQIAAARLEMQASTIVQSGVMDRVLRLPVGFFRQYSSGELTQRTLAISRLERLATTGMIQGMLAGVFSIFSLALMIHYAPQLVLPSVAFATVFVGCSFWVGRAQTGAARQATQLGGAVSSRMLEIVQGIEKLRIARAEPAAFERWAHAFHQQQRAAYREKRMKAFSTVINASFLPVVTLGVILTIGASGVHQDLSTAQIVSFLSCFAIFTGSLNALVRNATEFAGMRPIYEFSAPILQEIPENQRGGLDPGSLRGRIALTGIKFSYHEGAALVLDGLDLEIEAGEYIAVVGDSGCGKSTLLRLLMGFETPNSGTVSVDGIDLRQMDLRRMRRQIGVVMQSAKPLPGSIFDNIVGTNFELTMEDVQRAARMVGLEEDVARMPMGYQTALTDGSGSFSGGQIQRIMLARAIAADPRILILDEATSALDNRTQATVTRTMAGLGGVTRIVVAHRLSTIVAADRIIVLENGRVIEIGTYKALMAQQGKFAALAERQLA
ncbi:ATP-binding cassette domain-containing protein [Phycobacter sp. K97]|uniref:ATP-binding cassette domain-containing protein n=1 Tax=Phycobacter sedimenti TaxID=3133977 RepID=UPI00311F28E5